MQGSCSIKRTSKKLNALTNRKASRTLYHCTICKKQATYDERDKHLKTRIHKVNAKEAGREGSEEGVFKTCCKTQDCQGCKPPAFLGKSIRKQTKVYSADFLKIRQCENWKFDSVKLKIRQCEIANSTVWKLKIRQTQIEIRQCLNGIRLSETGIWHCGNRATLWK